MASEIPNTTDANKTETHRANTSAMVDLYETYMAELDAIEAGQAAREAL